MNTVRADFDTRAAEVAGYFQFVLGLAEERLHVCKPGSTEKAFPPDDHEGLLKTLKAGCYLLLYNLVESTMRNAIEAIFDELRTKKVGFDACREEIKQEVLSNFKKRNVDKLLPRLLDLARDVVVETFERSETFGGNLDAQTIRKTATRYGFPAPDGTKSWMLRTVKDNRNDLAHGVKSFADVGRNALPSELEEARKQTVAILSETLDNISDYLAQQHYLAANAGGVI